MKAVFDWMLTVGSALSQLAYAVFANSRNSNLSISGESFYAISIDKQNKMC